MYVYAKNLQPISMERQERLAGINASLQENITGIRVVRTFAAQDREYEVFSKEVRNYEKILVRRGEISALFIPILLISSMSAIIYIIGVNMIELNYIGQDFINILGIEFKIQPFSVGDLIAFLTLMGLLVFPTSILRFLLDVITLGFAGSSRIFDTLTTKSILVKGKNKELKNLRGKIEFKNVSFAYDNTNNVLENISFEIESGETLAIIGSTGSGKSTIGKLLTRMYDINKGEILLDDYNLLDLKISDVRNNISTIEQDIVLFSTTIKENIAYGVEGIDENKIINAAKLAQAHEFINEFHEGYDTIVGEKGVTLSGGQKQRIAMARTFIKNPKILIIDDSTSAIDAKTEKMINDAMREILKNRTTIIITHRLSNLIDADKILFLQNGIAKKIGTHEELIKNFDPYRQIFSVYQELPPIEEGEK
jgi:ATP-binding cassette subfamily B protein